MAEYCSSVTLITNILEAQKKGLCEVTQMDDSQICISAAVCIHDTTTKAKLENESWYWLKEPDSIAGTLELDQLRHDNTMFHNVLNSKDSPFLFKNDKEKDDGIAYVMDGRDQDSINSNKPAGSIYCFLIQRSLCRLKINLVVSVSTYGQRLFPNVDGENSNQILEGYKANIIEINKYFENEMKHAMLVYFLEEVAKGNKSIFHKKISRWLKDKGPVEDIEKVETDEQ